MEQRDFLRKKMMKKTREQINEKFAGKEIHIIKAVNLLTALDSINNLMSENASEWKVRQPTGEAEEAYIELEKNTQSIAEEKDKLMVFIEKEMGKEFPNFSALATPILGAKLLASAGSKKRLCFMPASTIQVLGAEKALFAHLRKNAKSPKHGHLFNHPLLQNLPRFKRGTAARIIAGKLSIALKVDYFDGENNSSEIQKELEERISELAAQKATPKQEQQERDFESINAERRKEQFEKDNKKKDYRREEQFSGRSFEQKKYTPEERRQTFGMQGMRRNNYPNENKPRQWQEKSFAFPPRREGSFAPRREGNFAPRREGSYNSDSRPSGFAPRRDFGSRESFGPRREGRPSGAQAFAPRREGGYSGAQGFGGQKREGFSTGEGGYRSTRSDSEGRSSGGHSGAQGFAKKSFGGRKYGKPKKYGKKY